jgi:multidrug transporter EmrE-like cation transporter
MEATLCLTTNRAMIVIPYLDSSIARLNSFHLLLNMLQDTVISMAYPVFVNIGIDFRLVRNYSTASRSPS